jgi:CysZ protein
MIFEPLLFKLSPIISTHYDNLLTNNYLSIMRNHQITPSVSSRPNHFVDFADGVTSYGAALSVIFRLKLWSYLVIPGLLSLALGGSIAYGAYTASSGFAHLLSSAYPTHWIGASIVGKISGVASWLILGVSGLFTYRILLMALVAPFMSPLAARVQGDMLGTVVYDPPFFSFTNVRLILRGAILSFRNLMKELWFTFWLLLLGLFPPFTLIVPFILFAVQAFYSGFGNLDYSLEKYYGIADSKDFSKRHRWLAVGNGTVFLVLLAVPVLGLFFAPALSAVAATLESVKRIDTPLKNVKALEQFI